MNAHIIIGIVALAGVLVVGAPLGGDAKAASLKEKVERGNAAKVSIEQAIKTASEKVSGKVIEAELEKKHKKTVWEVEVLTPDGKVTEVHLDIDTGTIIDIEVKTK
jgi:uncharacterized membrane protein YkoI